MAMNIVWNYMKDIIVAKHTLMDVSENYLLVLEKNLYLEHGKLMQCLYGESL